MPALALFQPEIAQNVGTLLRFGACLDISVHVIEPCGFLMTDKKLIRAGMDYLDLASLARHSSWEAFVEQRPQGRLIATTPHTDYKYCDFAFQPDDVILMGQESIGLPQDLIDSADAAVAIPMTAQTRSLNLAVSAAIITTEVLRQTQTFPKG